MMKFLGKVGQGFTHHGKEEGRHSKKEKEDEPKKKATHKGTSKKKSAGKAGEADKSPGSSKPGSKKGGSKKKGEPSLGKKSRSIGEGRTGKDATPDTDRECVTEEIIIKTSILEATRDASEDDDSCSDDNSDSQSPQGLRQGGGNDGSLDNSLAVSGDVERALSGHSLGPLLSGNEEAKASLPLSDTLKADTEGDTRGDTKGDTKGGQVPRSEGSYADTSSLTIETKGRPPKLPLSQGSQRPTSAAAVASSDVGGPGAPMPSFKNPMTPRPVPSRSVDSVNAGDGPSEELQPALEACGSESVSEQQEGLAALRALSKQGKQARQDMVSAGTVETLLRLQSSEDEEVLNLVLLVLLNLSFDDETIQEMGVIVPFAKRLLSHASPTIRESAAAVVFSLSRHEFHREALLQESVVRPLVGVLASGTEQGKRDSCKALFHLSYLPDSYEVLLKAGVVEPAIELLYPPDSKIAEKATCLLANIVRCPEGCEAIAESDQGLLSLVEVINDGSHLGKEFAAAALLLIAQSNGEYRDSLIQESPFIGLGRLQDTGTARAKIKATALLQLIREDKGNDDEEEDEDEY